jgi:hypothetical protein
MNTIFKQTHEVELTPELVEAYAQRGRELRAEAIARAMRRLLGAPKRQHTRAAGRGNAPSAAARA